MSAPISVDKDLRQRPAGFSASSSASASGQADGSESSSPNSAKNRSAPGLTPPGKRMIIRSTTTNTSYECIKASGKGSFGVVYKATNLSNQSVVAIKRVLQDRRYKNRELQIMKMLNHVNICKLKDNFYEHTKEGVFLNLVLEYVPKNLYEITVSFHKQRKHTPMLLVKLYIYQMLRSLAYIHSLGICHRDIKPQNLLINPETHELKLCDFGSAKILIKGEPNVSYICSRYYRAPELIFGATDYTSAIDIWSTGCVMAELLLGTPLFAGESGVDQLVEIIKVLGTPTKEQIYAMNSNYKEFKFPQIKPHSWREVFPANTPDSALDLISKMLEYKPQERATALEACAHPFFDELRQPNSTLMTGRALPPLFNFSPEELALAHERGLLERLIPKHQLGQIPTNFLISNPSGSSSAATGGSSEDDGITGTGDAGQQTAVRQEGENMSSAAGAGQLDSASSLV